MDKLQAITVFIKIAECGSLTGAAEQLGKSLPAVVRILAALEETIQVRLFNRTTRKIALTEEGQIYLERCKKILADIDEAESIITNEQIEPSGSITVTAPVRFGEMYVSPAVVKFLNQYPRMQVNLLLLDRVVNLLDEGIDVAVRISPLEDSSLIARPVGKIRQVVCASPELLNKFGRPKHPTELSGLPCLRYSGISTGHHWLFNDGTKKLKVKVNGRYACNHVASSIDACVAGAGFGSYLSYQVLPLVKSGKLEIILEKYEQEPLPVSLVYQHRQLVSSRIRVFIDYLGSQLSKLALNNF
jgi:DNA-binding transcriptional LysR family regulator